MISRRRSEIKSLQSKKNSKNLGLKEKISRRFDVNWRPRRAISLDHVKNNKERSFFSEKKKNLKTFLVEKSKIFYKEIKGTDNLRSRSLDPGPVNTPFSQIFQHSKIKIFAMGKGDFYDLLPNDVKIAFREKVRKFLKCEIDDYFEKRVDSLTNVVVNGLFRARHLNKFNLVKTPDFLYLQTRTKVKKN